MLEEMFWAKNSNLEQNIFCLLFANDRKIFAQDEEGMRHTLVELSRENKNEALCSL